MASAIPPSAAELMNQDSNWKLHSCVGGGSTDMKRSFSYLSKDKTVQNIQVMVKLKGYYRCMFTFFLRRTLCILTSVTSNDGFVVIRCEILTVWNDFNGSGLIVVYIQQFNTPYIAPL